MAEAGALPRQGTEFTGDVYLAAATERAGSLQGLYDDREWVLALYNAGLAVEAMFRAYRTRFDPEFSSRHDLNALAREARFVEIVPPDLDDTYGANLGVVVARWSNSHRYRSEAAARNYLKRARLDRGIKGDFLKENARKAVNAAIELVALGVRRWKSSLTA